MKRPLSSERASHYVERMFRAKSSPKYLVNYYQAVSQVNGTFLAAGVALAALSITQIPLLNTWAFVGVAGGSILIAAGGLRMVWALGWIRAFNQPQNSSTPTVKQIGDTPLSGKSPDPDLPEH